eukprot:TRINITY_DN1838_c0_g3_i3.p1 TRINITY_DN1838_c0_g3~~TRINITY_DN1838_c0_g3_i3.p1  ORF type:complete len:232 (+),score=65.31 TRINITY_DN1838_c0_g3_i3:53-748(+)
MLCGCLSSKICFFISIFFSILIAYLIWEGNQNKFERIEEFEKESFLKLELINWKQKGFYFTLIEGEKIFVIDQNSTNLNSSETLVIIHGFPTSSFDFHLVLDKIIKDGFFKRIVLCDLLGYGLSDKPFNFSYSVFEFADHLQQLWNYLNINDAHILAHDMGDTVATELLSRRERGLLGTINFKSVTFTNGGMRIDLANFRITQILLRLPIIGKLISKFTVIIFKNKYFIIM